MTSLELLESTLAEVNEEIEEARRDISKLEKLPYSLDLVNRYRDLQLLMTRRKSLEMQVRVSKDHAGITNYID